MRGQPVSVLGTALLLSARPVAGWGFWDLLPAPTAEAGFEDAAQRHGGVYAPEPTKPPYLGVELLRKRQSDGSMTCGYFDALSQFPEGCNAGAVCVTNPVFRAMGCCPADSPVAGCYIATGCTEATPATSSNSSANPYVTTCSAVANPRCFTEIWPISAQTFTYYGCSTANSVVTIYESFTNGPAAAAPSNTHQWVGQTTTIPTTVLLTVTPSPTSSASKGSGKGASIGAIVGGAVGGFALLAAFVVAILFFCCRRRKARSENPSAPPVSEAQNYHHRRHSSTLPTTPATSYNPLGSPQSFKSAEGSTFMSPQHPYHHQQPAEHLSTSPTASTLPSVIPIAPPYQLPGSPSSFQGHVQFAHPQLPSLQEQMRMQQQGPVEMPASTERREVYEMAGDGARRGR